MQSLRNLPAVVPTYGTDGRVTYILSLVNSGTAPLTGLTITSIGTSQEGADTDTIKRIALMCKMAGNASNSYKKLSVVEKSNSWKDCSVFLMWEGAYLSRTKESVFSWDLVAGWTARLIDK